MTRDEAVTKLVGTKLVAISDVRIISVIEYQGSIVVATERGVFQMVEKDGEKYFKEIMFLPSDRK